MPDEHIIEPQNKDLTPVDVAQPLEQPHLIRVRGGESVRITRAITSPQPAASQQRIEFIDEIDELWIYNNSGATIYIDWSGQAAGLGSWPVPSGVPSFLPLHIESLSIYVTQPTPINAANGVRIEGLN